MIASVPASIRAFSLIIASICCQDIYSISKITNCYWLPMLNLHALCFMQNTLLQLVLTYNGLYPK